MNKIVCFGEIMGRLNPKGYLRFSQANELEISYAGAEANVAVSLARFGMNASFVTKLPLNDLGDCAVRELKKHGVDTSGIVFGGDRLGIYYVEKGASQRASKVIYDRKYSSVSMAQPSDFDWETLLNGASWFHFTGITPALGGYLPVICLEALKTAKKKGITISCDLNYRKNLWNRDQARETMSELMPYVDVCIANEEDASDVFGISADDTNLTSGVLSTEGYRQVAARLKERFGFRQVAITLRESLSANDNDWSALFLDSDQFYFSKTYRIHIVDRVGGGDSFGAALIYACIQQWTPDKIVNFAAAASCLKHSIEHDFNLVSLDEVMKLAQGDGSGRVQR
jgi:2-dehydro-3-deoxygluconokinase